MIGLDSHMIEKIGREIEEHPILPKVASLKQRIEKKAVTFHDMIKSYSRSWEQVKVVKENKRWVKLSDVLDLLPNYDIHPKGESVCIPRKPLEEICDNTKKELEACKGERTPYLERRFGEYRILSKLLEESK